MSGHNLRCVFFMYELHSRSIPLFVICISMNCGIITTSAVPGSICLLSPSLGRSLNNSASRSILLSIGTGWDEIYSTCRFRCSYFLRNALTEFCNTPLNEAYMISFPSSFAALSISFNSRFSYPCVIACKL